VNNKVTIEPMTLRTLNDFYKHMRAEDLAECLVASNGQNFLDTPISELMAYGAVSIMYDHKECLGIAGYRDGMIWMVCTDHVLDHKVAFLRYTKECVMHLRKNSKVPLCNSVWKKNIVHVEWLKWLGAETLEEDENFYHFALNPIEEGDEKQDV